MCYSVFNVIFNVVVYTSEKAPPPFPTSQIFNQYQGFYSQSVFAALGFVANHRHTCWFLERVVQSEAFMLIRIHSFCSVFNRDGRYLLFYFRSDTDIFKPSIVDIDTDIDTCKLKWSFKLLKEYNQ